MSFKTKDNTGSLFKNEDKANPNGPDYSGSAMVDGVDYFFDAWLKTAETGRRWMSFSFKAKTKQAGKPAPTTQSPRRNSQDDEAPF